MFSGMEFCLASSKYPNMGARSAVESVIAAYGGQSSTLCKQGMHCVVATPEDVAKDTKKIRKAVRSHNHDKSCTKFPTGEGMVDYTKPNYSDVMDCLRNSVS